jgi:phenylalanyl-tRNA synthetase beta chain
LDWVSDFVDLSDLTPERIADQLTLSTAEVEGFEVLRRAVDGVFVGEIVALEPVPAAFEAAKLHVVEVDCGSRRYTSVCGAPNLRVGMKAPFAPPGTTLANGVRIEVSELAGRRSEGVLCSAMELGMSRWHEVVLECPGTIANGTPLAAHVPAQDVILEIDNKSLTHRPDLWGHYGIARELAAVFRRPLKPLPVADLGRFDALPAYPLSVEDFDACPCYGCLEFRVAAAAPSPLIVQRRLHALGQRTFGLLVDLTNYVMWELAQPTHAFDGDTVRAIRVAPMGRHGTFTTLDGQQRAMLPDDLLIWNQREPVALAGVMGGLASEVRPTTTRVLLESANFKASRIRRTSVRLDLRTESAQRFEKSQPPAHVKLGIARILHLVEQSGAQPEVTSRFTVAGDLKDAYRPLTMPRAALRAMAGKDLPDDEVLAILHALDFQARFDGEQLCVGIPPHRSEKDISIPADIAEEVLRIYGYGRIEPRMPAVPIEPVYVETALRLEHKARRLLAGGHGFIEVQSYGWFDDVWLAQLGYTPRRTLELRNPSAQQNHSLRTTLVPNLLALVRPNRAHRDAFRLFELGRVYWEGDHGKAVEQTRLAGISFQQAGYPPLEEHFRAIKGAIEDLGRLLGCGPLGFEAGGPGEAPWQMPGHFASIRRGDRAVGALGVLAGKILETVAQEGQVVWFELSMEALDGSIYPELKYVPAPVYPGSWQDFSLVWDIAEGFAALEARLNRFAHPLVVRREFVTVYKGKGLAPGKGSYSFRYWLGAPDHTLSSGEIEQFRSAFLAFLAAEGVPLRG